MKIWRSLGAVLGVGVLTLGGTAIALASSTSVNGAGGQALSVPVDQGCGVEPLDLELVIDVSGSMQSNVSNGHTRLYWAQAAAKQLIHQLETAGGVGAYHMVGVSRFNGTSASVVRALSGGFDEANLDAAIDGLSASGSTPLKAGMSTGAADLNALADGHQHVVVLVSDGRPNPDQGPNGLPATGTNGQRPTQAQIDSYLGAADVAISVAIGTGGSGSSAIDLGLMGLIGPDGAYHVINGDELGDVFSAIFKQIACETSSSSSETSSTSSETSTTSTESSTTSFTSSVEESSTTSFTSSEESTSAIPTEPNTATIGTSGPSNPSNGLWLLFAGLGVVGGSLLVLVPSKAKNKR